MNERDLPARVRTLSRQWFETWASLGIWDEQTSDAIWWCLCALREAERHVRGCPDQRTPREIIAAFREGASLGPDVVRPVLLKAADELEALVLAESRAEAREGDYAEVEQRVARTLTEAQGALREVAETGRRPGDPQTQQIPVGRKER